MTPPPPPPGWYPAPEDQSQERWWSGRDWTGAYRPTAAAIVPPPAPVDPPSSVSPLQQPAAKTSGKTIAVVVIVLIVLIGGPLLALAASGWAASAVGNSSSVRSSSNVHTVRYIVTGTASSAMVTYSTPTGIEQQDTGIPMMNTNGEQGVEFTAPSGTALTISAQNRDESGDVSCTISVDGNEVSNNTSGAQYGIASCSGLVP